MSKIGVNLFFSTTLYKQSWPFLLVYVLKFLAIILLTYLFIYGSRDTPKVNISSIYEIRFVSCIELFILFVQYLHR